jgi:hypothetical protein
MPGVLELIEEAMKEPIEAYCSANLSNKYETQKIGNASL